MLALASAKTGHFDIERCSRANVNERAHQDLRTVGIVGDAELTFEFRRSPKVDLGAVYGKHSSSTPAFKLVAVRSLARLRQGVKKLTKDFGVEASASLAYRGGTYGLERRQGQFVLMRFFPKVRQQMPDAAPVPVSNHEHQESREKLRRKNSIPRKVALVLSVTTFRNRTKSSLQERVNLVTRMGVGTIFSRGFSLELFF